MMALSVICKGYSIKAYKNTKKKWKALLKPIFFLHFNFPQNITISTISIIWRNWYDILSNLSVYIYLRLYIKYEINLSLLITKQNSSWMVLRLISPTSIASLTFISCSQLFLTSPFVRLREFWLAPMTRDFNSVFL